MSINFLLTMAIVTLCSIACIGVLYSSSVNRWIDNLTDAANHAVSLVFQGSGDSYRLTSMPLPGGNVMPNGNQRQSVGTAALGNFSAPGICVKV